MTAPDVRTAARAYAFAQDEEFPDPGMTALEVETFAAGAVWGAALVTPTREQIAQLLYKTCWGDMVSWEYDSEMFYDQAAAVLALMKRKGENE